MKKAVCIIIAVFTVLCALSSCSSQKEEDTSAVSSTLPEISDEKNEKGQTKMRYFRDPDGTLVYKTEYTYDEFNNVIREKKMKADGTFDSMVDYEFKKIGDTYKEIKKTVYKSETEVNYYFDDYEYKEVVTDGVKEVLTISYIRYNADGSFFEKFRFIYDDDNSLTGCETLDEKGNIRTKSDYN